METCYIFCDYNSGHNKIIKDRPPTQEEYEQVAQGDAALFKLEQDEEDSIFITVSECQGDDDWRELSAIN